MWFMRSCLRMTVLYIHNTEWEVVLFFFFKHQVDDQIVTIFMASPAVMCVILDPSHHVKFLNFHLSGC